MFQKVTDILALNSAKPNTCFGYTEILFIFPKTLNVSISMSAFSIQSLNMVEIPIANANNIEDVHLDTRNDQVQSAKPHSLNQFIPMKLLLFQIQRHVKTASQSDKVVPDLWPQFIP